MANFLFVYRSNPASMAAMGPEDRQKHMDQWFAWVRQAMQQGWMLHPGDALQPAGKVVTATVVTDGPFVESKEVLGGYSIVQAESLEAAANLAKGCPGVDFGGSVEVRPLAGFSV